MSSDSFDELKEESPYKCSFCNKAFPDRDAFESHQSSIHRDRQSI